jgi:hypothetical protein
MLSMVIWQGLAIISGIVKHLRHGNRTLGESSIPEALAPKAWRLIPVPVLFAAAAGVVTGLLGDVGVVPTVGAYASVGLLYGMCCFWLGRAGMLPILDD